MRHFWPLILFAIIFVISILGANQTSTPVESRTEKPQRIITLAPNITEIAFALGLDKKIIAVTKYCDYPAQAMSLPKVGGFIDPNIEAIVALQPDLVILIATQQHTIKQLQQLNITTLGVDNATLSDITNSIKMIGEATQHQQQAQQLLSNIKQKIHTITAKLEKLERPKVMLTMGHSTNNEQIKNVYIAGQHDFYNDLILLAGGENVYQSHHLKVPSLSIESIIQLNPDVIIDIFPEADDHNANMEQVKQRWKNLNYVAAVKQNQVHIIEENYATIPGPRIFQLLDKMARLIHPEVEWDTRPL